MTTALCSQPRGASSWTWPIDRTRYHPVHVFSPQELDALDQLVATRKAGRRTWPSGNGILSPFLIPIDDVLDLAQPCERSRREARSILLGEMHLRQLPFWGWDNAVWREILQGTSHTIQQRSTRVSHYRQLLMLFAYLLCDFIDLRGAAEFRQTSLTDKIFGRPRVDAAINRVVSQLIEWGYKPIRVKRDIPPAIRYLLLFNRSPFLEDLNTEKVALFRTQYLPEYLDGTLISITRVLANFEILSQPLEPKSHQIRQRTTSGTEAVVSTEWAELCERWVKTSTLAPATRKAIYGKLLQVGRWLATNYPAIKSPAQWTREIASDFVATVDRWKIGDWGAKTEHIKQSALGKPLSARTKAYMLAAIRIFFRDCQEWEWIPRQLDAGRCFRTPRSIQAQIGPNPRTIQDDIWAKLLWAGLNLTSDDIPGVTWNETAHLGEGERSSWYPLEMVRALVLVWLFTGLRSDEIRRLRVGSIRIQAAELSIGGAEDSVPKHVLCWLNVPVNKTHTAFTKPVDLVVGEAIEAWEKVRPSQPLMVDSKTAEVVQFLFAYRGHVIGKSYLNIGIIPMLCHKAGVPEQDVRGKITSHRARSTIASQLANAKEPMTLLELKEWLGHRRLESTLQYVGVTPTRLARSFQKAGYFERNIRSIEVLIDQEAVKSGAAAQGEPWRFYDLGHGYCTYDFFDQCPHRMACAKCSFYVPKVSTKAQLLEAKANLQHMLQEIPLTEEERAAVEDGVAAVEKLSAELVDVPTPAGPTPRQLNDWQSQAIELSPLDKTTEQDMSLGN